MENEVIVVPQDRPKIFLDLIKFLLDPLLALPTVVQPIAPLIDSICEIFLVLGEIILAF